MAEKWKVQKITISGHVNYGIYRCAEELEYLCFCPTKERADQIAREHNQHQELVEALETVWDSGLLMGVTELHDKLRSKVNAALAQEGEG